jgi:hypothetical protein
MLSARIAVQLCSRGHDVEAVEAITRLRGLSDPDLFQEAQGDERAIVTYNREDFLAPDREYRSRGSEHHGIVILHPRRFPQGHASSPALTLALAALLSTGRPYPNFVHWLQ